MATPEEILRQRHSSQLEESLERTESASHVHINAYSTEMARLDDTMDATPAPLVTVMRQLEEAPFPVQMALTERRESRSEKKKRESMEKQQQKAKKALLDADKEEARFDTTRHFRSERRNADGDLAMSKEEYQQEQAVLNKRLNAITQQEQADLLAADLAAMKQQTLVEAGGDAPAPEEAPEALRKKVLWDAQRDRVEAYKIMAGQMPLGSKERAQWMAKKEEAVLKAGLLRQEWKVACMPAGKEKERETATIKRHAKFDALKKLFRKPSPYSHEDATVTVVSETPVNTDQATLGTAVTVERKTLVNTGRATLGGTKAMYVFEEQNGQEWLFKEATNCLGMAKPEGAVVTEEASKLQQRLRGDLSIPAHCLRDASGKVVGSLQKRMQKAEGGVDLFKWQAQGDLRENAPSKTTLDDLMHEHTLDWILCNFDTKGENFINQPNDHIISFDKEASFNTLLQEESKHMSYTFKPHSNDTIYNTMFAAFARGEIELDLDANMESIQKLESIPADEFIALFRETLDVKYGTSGADREQAEQVLRERHQNLRREYRTFYTQLLRERLEVTRDPEEREKLHRLMPEGTFAFKDEREGNA